MQDGQERFYYRGDLSKDLTSRQRGVGTKRKWMASWRYRKCHFGRSELAESGEERGAEINMCQIM